MFHPLPGVSSVRDCPPFAGTWSLVRLVGLTLFDVHLLHRFPVEVARRARWKFLESPKLLVTNPLVKGRRLESVRVYPDCAASSGNSLCLEEFNQATAPTLATNFFVYPECAEIEPAVVGVAVGAAEDSPVPAKPNCQRKLYAISPERCRAIELLDPVLEDLDLLSAWVPAYFKIEVVASWLISSHE